MSVRCQSAKPLLLRQLAVAIVAFCIVGHGSAAYGQVGVQEPEVDVDRATPSDEVEGGQVREGEPVAASPSEGTVNARRLRRQLGSGVHAVSAFMLRTTGPGTAMLGVPSDEDIGGRLFSMGLLDGIVVTPQTEGAQVSEISLSQIASLGTDRFHVDAIRWIELSLEAWFDELGFLATVRFEDANEVRRARMHGDEPLLLRGEIFLDRGPYQFSGIEITYQTEADHPQHPPIDQILATSVSLGLGPDGLVQPDERFGTTTLVLSEIGGDGAKQIYWSGLSQIVRAITSHLVNDQGLAGVVSVIPDFDPIDGSDLRTDSDVLRVHIYTAVVGDVRTLAFGDRIGVDGRENHALHDRVIRNSPVQPWDGEGDRNDLLRRQALDDYLYLLNRVPGRRVDAAVSALDDGRAQLDFLIAERKPVLMYAQVSNTGTEATDTTRYRLGFNWVQPTNSDDILSIDYITAGFDESHAVIGSYGRRIGENDRLRFRVSANYSEYTASDVGFSAGQFEGDSWAVSGEVIYNVMQRRELFIDVFAGARWQHQSVDNTGVGLTADSDFFLPRIGARAQRDTRTSRLFADVRLEINLPDVASTDDEGFDLDALGRIDSDRDWVVLKWDITQSIYLEPILFGQSWRDVTTPRTSTLAHELAFVFRGQHSFDSRLVPQEEQVAGGLYSVRGYPESLAAGDTVLIGSVEYRFHLPNALPFTDQTRTVFGRPFRVRPQEPFGDADWDFVLKGFVDAARSENASVQAFESNETLLSVGVGLEFSFLRYLSARVDWGVALRDTEAEDVNSGDQELHFVVTFLF